MPDETPKLLSSPPCAPHPFSLDQRLRRSERILNRADFLHVQNRGRRSSNPALIAIVSPCDRPWSRIGVTVSKKVGNAVVRNTIKRRLRAIFRRTKPQLPKGLDIVWIARPKIVDYTSAELERLALRSTLRAVTSAPKRKRTR